MLAPLSLLLLPVAALSGWWVARRHSGQLPENHEIKVRKDYFKGLNHLINDEPDKAVDVFIQVLKVDVDTIETHLALGNLFRRRGEVDRAIRVHRNLIARPQLSMAHKSQALSALGQDYLCAGVLDRAERLFLELVEMNAHNESSLRFLLRIYEQEKDWEKAIVAAGKLEAYSKRSMKPVIAQYYCELAEFRITTKKYSDAKSYLKSARSADARCVRESMLRGYLAMELHEYREAIRHYLRAKKKNIHYLSEIVQQLTICYEKCADEQAYVLFLQESIAESPCYAIIFALSEHYKQKNGIEFAISFVVEQLKHRPSSRGLSYLTSLYLLILNEKSSEPLQTLLSLMYGLIAEKPLYQCTQCGFSCKELFWLCPSCHGWNSISPSI